MIYFLPASKVAVLILSCLTVPPMTGSRVDSTRSSCVRSVLNSVRSKFNPVRFPAVAEYLMIYSAAVVLESRSSPGAVNSTVMTSGAMSTTVRSVTWPGGILSWLRSTSFVTWNPPPAACLVKFPVFVIFAPLGRALLPQQRGVWGSGTCG